MEMTLSAPHHAETTRAVLRTCFFHIFDEVE